MTASDAPLVTITLDTPIIPAGHDEVGEPTGWRTVADAIVDQAADRLVEKLHVDVRKAVLGRVEDQIESQVREMVAEIIATPVRITNLYGEPTARTVSVRERIDAEIAKALTERDSLSRGSLISELIKKEVEQALRADLGAAITQARERVVGSVRDQAAELIAKAVKDGLR